MLWGGMSRTPPNRNWLGEETGAGIRAEGQACVLRPGTQPRVALGQSGAAVGALAGNGKQRFITEGLAGGGVRPSLFLLLQRTTYNRV